METQLIIPERFWRELEEVYLAEVEETGDRPESEDGDFSVPTEFWEELQAVYEEEAENGSFDYDPSKEPSDEVLKELETALKIIQEKAAQEVEDERGKNPDSPLFLPFSLFEPMERERDEVHYTKTLAWFMEPNNPHGFGNAILKTLLNAFPLDDSVYSNDLHAVAEVWDDKRENRLDIAIMHNDRIVVAIEAKVDAEEGKRSSGKGEKNRNSSQLRAYDKWLDREHPDSKNNRIFLVPDEERKTGSGKWKKVTWRRVAKDLLKFLQEADKTAASHHYLSLFVASIIRDIDGVDPKNIVATASYLNAL